MGTPEGRAPNDAAPNDAAPNDTSGAEAPIADSFGNDYDTRDEHRKKQTHEREQRILGRFQASTKGLRRVFEKHFPDDDVLIEALVFHLAQVEAQIPTAREAIRSARYPGSGDRHPRRMVMGLWENLSAIHNHLRSSIQCLEKLGSDGLTADDDDEPLPGESDLDENDA
jgi:hypothetical protein